MNIFRPQRLSQKSSVASSFNASVSDRHDRDSMESGNSHKGQMPDHRTSLASSTTSTMAMSNVSPPRGLNSPHVDALMYKLTQELEATELWQVVDGEKEAEPIRSKLRGMFHDVLTEHMTQIVDDCMGSVEQQTQAILKQMDQGATLEEILQQTVLSVFQTIPADRVLIYQFHHAGQGQVVAEAMVKGYTPSQDLILPTVMFGEETASEYSRHRPVQIGLGTNSVATPRQRQLLDQFQVQQSLSLPIFRMDEIWGLLVIQHCSPAQPWTATEISVLDRVTDGLTLALQPQLWQSVQENQRAQQAILTTLNEQVTQGEDKQVVLRTTTHAVRHQLGCDRLVLFQFNADWTGSIMAEATTKECPSMGTVGESIHLMEDYFQHASQQNPSSKEHCTHSVVVDDIHQVGYPIAHLDQLEQYDIEAYVLVPLVVSNRLWGLLGAYQTVSTRQWQDTDIQFLAQVGGQLGTIIQQHESTQALSQEKTWAEALNKIASLGNQAPDFKTLLQKTVQEIRLVLGVDRVAVYRSYPQSGHNDGEFVAESLGSNIPSALNISIHDHCFGEQYVEKYADGFVYAIPDVYANEMTQCHLDLYKQLNIQANLIVPLTTQGELWGMLCAHQCHSAYEWGSAEIQFMQRVASQFGVLLQQADYIQTIEKRVQQDQAIAKISNTLRQQETVENMDELFNSVVNDVRQTLKSDRVVVYRFNPDWSGYFIAESAGAGWNTLMRLQETRPEILANVSDCSVSDLADTFLQETGGGGFGQGMRYRVCPDIYQANFSPCHVELLEEYQARGYIISAIFVQKTLWGLLATYQNTGPRNWDDDEVDFLEQVATQMGVAIQQQKYIEDIQRKSRQDQALSSISTTLRQQVNVDNMDGLFNTIVTEIRHTLKSDRVVVYRFNPDWSGYFVAESVTPGWNTLMQLQESRPEILANVSSCSVADLADTFLQETEGGPFVQGEVYRVCVDVDKANFSPCHVELLQEYQARSYVIVAIFVQKKLWGLLAAYQNSGPRNWIADEIGFLEKSAIQMGSAIQQQTFIKTIQQQAEDVQIAAEREKENREALQQEVIQLLSSVRPALMGDLTVRALVTENEVGTVADAYNNTLQSLRRLVIQVQEAAANVAQTSQHSEHSVIQLADKAEQQLQSLDNALEGLKTMRQATENVASSAKQVENAAEKANQMVQEGDAAMNRTVDGILSIRETVADTGKRIKRLSESSQRISKVVRLISDFTTQTHLLSLNAAIEATRAGEYGRGFAVVADEIRALASQSAAATTEIDELVKEIQLGTAAVSSGMETGIQQVVDGTALVTDARKILTSIVEATLEIGLLVEQITYSTKQQTQQTQTVTHTMEAVAAIATETNDDSAQLSTSFTQLIEMAQALQSSVGKFKVS